VVLDISDRVVAIHSPTVGQTILNLPFKDGTDSCAYVNIISHLDEILVVVSIEMSFLTNCLICH
jgi:hypothetical protein